MSSVVPDPSGCAARKPSEAPLVHTSFYRFVAIGDPDAVVAVLRELVQPLTGSVLVAEEGISGALAATADRIDAFERSLQHDPRLQGLFLGMPFKHSACTTPPFWKVRVHRKREIVALGMEGVSPAPLQSVDDEGHAAEDAPHLSPQAWRELIAQDNVVVIDNRNSFEFRLGRFKNAVNPQVDNFRDFPQYVQAHAERWRAEGKRVAMYCTGGIRCEKTGPWMKQLGLDVYQLDGGILNYFQALPDAEREWQGECFVFDNRIAIDTRLRETGTTADDVYDDSPDEAWRLERAHRLDSVHPKKRRQRPHSVPTRDGVNPSCVALPSGPWLTVLDFLAGRLPLVSRDEWAARMRDGDVVDAQGHDVPPDAPYRPQTKLYYWRALPFEHAVPFEERVIFQDDLIVVADKPHFLPVTPKGRYVQETLLVRLQRRLGIDTLAPVHRIDRETAGLVLFTIQARTRNAYQSLFRERAVQKAYEAIAPLNPTLRLPLRHQSRLEESPHFMAMHEVPGQPNAETLIELIESSGRWGRFKLSPVTGQRHQLRAHMAALGMPILNDQIYPELKPALAPDQAPDYSAPLQLLAQSLSFIDPITGQHRSFDCGRQLDLRIAPR